MLDLEPMKKALAWHEKAKLPYEGTIMARSLVEEIEKLRTELVKATEALRSIEILEVECFCMNTREITGPCTICSHREALHSIDESGLLA